MRKILLTVLFAGLLVSVKAQRTDYPLIGAQVFVEPGQSADDIDRFFAILADHGMKVARVRLFGSHMLRADGSWDFALYDAAFDAADRYGIKLFATLFPPADELLDVGGFKFPRSEAHLDEIAGYIEAMATHFSKKPALHTWVLQNEPGTSAARVERNDLSDRVRREWEAGYPRYERGSGYLKADFDEEHFLAYYTTWYLDWIAGQVRARDSEHYTHINPHNLFDNLAEYDFPAYSGFLTSLGASMHASWHFGYFDRRQYPLGVSMMADIIRAGAGENPFWITEMQGGGVTASGNIALCPTAAEISQWLWTGMAAGAEGIIFWTLNPRKSVMEAGEWAMIDFLRRPTDRLTAAAGVAAAVAEHRDFFSGAQPVKSGIAILYNNESLLISRRNAAVSRDSRNEARKSSAVMKSVAAAYEAVSSRGIVPEIFDMETFGWNPAEYPAVLLPNIISLPWKYHQRIRDYVAAGGRLTVTGFTGYYDGDMACLFMDGFPLSDCFGGAVTEFRAIDGAAAIDPAGVPLDAGGWKGLLRNSGGEAICGDGDGVTGIRNRFGKGVVTWVPSPVDLGGWRGGGGLGRFYWNCVGEAAADYPVLFREHHRNVLMRLMRNGGSVLAVIVNKNGEPARIGFETSFENDPVIIYGSARVRGGRITIPADGVAVCLWE